MRQNSFPKLCKEDLCTGCTACAMVCPVTAISMQSDSEGFLRPIIASTLCIGCLQCERVCPVLHRNQPREPLHVYAAINKNLDVRLSSSSGGVFSILAQRTISQGGIVCGAGWSKDFKVVHKLVADQEALADLRGSKYVQSDLGQTFRHIKEKLHNQCPILFSGTPCQVAGLYAYLGECTAGLTTVDFVCHAIPSPLAFDLYLKELEDEYSASASSIHFRCKSSGWNNFSLRIVFNNGAQYQQPVSSDLFLQGFLRDMYSRPACHKCMFRELRSGADITLADYWDVQSDCNEMTDNKGTSLVLLNSEKGKAIWQSVVALMIVERSTYKDAVMKNPPLIYSSSQHPRRKTFFRQVKKTSSMRRLILLLSFRLLYRRWKDVIRLTFKKSKVGAYGK